MIVKRVNEQLEVKFHQLIAAMIGTAMKLGGCLEVCTYGLPGNGDPKQYEIHFKFDNRERLEQWVKSEERKTCFRALASENWQRD